MSSRQSIDRRPAFKLKARKRVSVYLTAQNFRLLLKHYNYFNRHADDEMINYVENVEQRIEQLMDKYGPNASIAILPLGPLVIPYIRK